MPLVGVSKCIAYYHSACGVARRGLRQQATTTVTTSDQEPIVIVEKALLVDYELANRQRSASASMHTAVIQHTQSAFAAGYGDV